MPTPNSITMRFRPLDAALLRAGVMTHPEQPLPWVMRPQYLPDFPWGQTPQITKDTST